MNDPSLLGRLAAKLGAHLAARGVTLATAESCTGGWIAKCVTDVPGSSAWFDAGFVCYSNAAKQALLGVPAKLIEAHGAVSRPVVAAMARGAIAKSKADLAVAVSGIAGPGGGSRAKPVGTVWFAFGRRHGRGIRIVTVKMRLTGDRAAVRRKAVTFALRELPRL